MFFMVTSHYAARNFIAMQTTAVTVPDVTNKLGLRAWGRNFGLVILPAAIGFFAGVSLFGDSAELHNLNRNFFTYSREFKSVRSELYY